MRGDLQCATVNGSHERRQSKKEKEEEQSGGRNERGLNQCHPLQLSAKKDRCSLSVGLCEHEGACHHKLASIRSCFPSSLFLL